MAKRFTDTKIWDDPWYQELPMNWKFFWKYICDKCDEAGIYKVNKSLAEFQMGIKLKWDDLNSFINNGKIRVFQYSSEIWIITDFVKFQYGDIENSNHAFHKKILKSISRYPIRYPIDTLSNRVYDTLLEEEKEKEEVREEEKDLIIPLHLSSIWPDFLEMRKSIKKPATPRAQKNIIAKLERLAPQNNEVQVQILDQSITNSWQDVFELRSNYKQVRKYGRQEVTMDELRKQAEGIVLS